MKIECRRIGKTPLEFKLNYEGAEFIGDIVFQKGSLFLLKWSY